MDEKAKSPVPAKTLSLIDSRDHFIGIALGKIIESQIANGKWEHGVAASHAVRYADAVMREKQTVQGAFAPGAQGTPFVPKVVPSATPQPGQPASGDESQVPVSPPAPVANPVKSLQDQLKETGEVAEVR